MNISYLKNVKGVTLTELIVALGISSILLIFIVSGSLFVQNYIKKWKQKDNVYEEISFITRELSNHLNSSKNINLFKDSMICFSNTGIKTTYSWTNNTFLKNEHNLLNINLLLDSLNVKKFDLPKPDERIIIKQGEEEIITGLYELFVKVSDKKKLTDSLRTIVRNEFSYIKYYQ